MKKIIIYILTVSAAVSCNFLDVPPADIYEAEITTGNGLKSVLRGTYAQMTVSALYGQMISGRMGLQADLGYNNYSVDAYGVAEHTVTTSDAKIRGYWQYFYKGINTANLLIGNASNVTDLTDEEKTDILGQAKFLRAYYYFMLTNKFGDIPLRTEFVSGDNDDKLQLAQTPSKEVYDFIIKEMEEAAGMVKDINEVKSTGVVSKSAVWGILARVCLYNAGFPNYAEGMYAKARMYAKKVIDTGYHSLNPSYSQVFINYMQDVYDMKESIWEVEFYGNDKNSYNTAGGKIGRTTGPRNKNLNTTIGYCLGTVRSNQFHYSLYDATDVRRDWNIADYYYSSDVDGERLKNTNNYYKFAGKFRREYELVQPIVNDSGPGNFPLLRYADVLLMYAEAYAADINANPEEEVLAYECFNRVRRRGHGLSEETADTSVDFPRTPNKTAFLEEIRDERARELAYEMLRKDDLVRWGIFYQRMKSSELIPPTSLRSSEYNYCYRTVSNVEPRDVRWPIPAAEMNVNGKLVQNEGW